MPQSNAWEGQIHVLQELFETTEDKKEAPSNLLPETEDVVTPFVWATKKPAKAKLTEPVKI